MSRVPTALRGRSGVFRRVTADVSGLYAANVVNGVLGVLFVPVAVRALGVAGYGVFSVYGVLAGYLVLVELGLGKNLFRILAACRTDEEERAHLRLAFGLYLGLAATVVVLAPFLAFVVTPVVFPMADTDRASVSAIALLTGVEYVVGVPVYLMQTRCLARERFGLYARFALVSGLVRYAMSFIGVLVFERPEAAVAVIVARRVLDVGAARLVMGALPSGSWTPRFALAEARTMLGRSSVLSLAQFLQLTVVAVGSVLVNLVQGVAALGVYRAAFDLASKLWFFSHPIGLVAFPRFVRMWADPITRRDLAVRLPRLLELSGLGYFAVAALVAGAGPILLPYVGMPGTAFGRLFALLAVAICLNAHANLANEFLQATGAYRLVAVLGASVLVCLVAVFSTLRVVAPESAIGWAWVGSQVAYVVAVDGVTLALLHVGARRLVVEIGVRVLALAAGVSLLRALERGASSATPMRLLLGILLVVCAARVLVVLRTGFQLRA